MLLALSIISHFVVAGLFSGTQSPIQHQILFKDPLANGQYTHEHPLRQQLEE